MKRYETISNKIASKRRKMNDRIFKHGHQLYLKIKEKVGMEIRENTCVKVADLVAEEIHETNRRRKPF